jgi:hypothetical protein
LNGLDLVSVSPKSPLVIRDCRGLAKQGDVEKIGFAGVSTRGLRSANHSWDEIGPNRVGMDPIVEFGERAVEIPRNGKASILVFLTALESAWPPV